MNITRVILINVGKDSDVSSIANDGSFPALGVVSLATVLKQAHPNIEVIAVDGQVTHRADIEAMINSFRPQLVGLSVLGSSYKTSLHFAAVAKSAGAVTIFGNDHAAVLGRQISPAAQRRRLYLYGGHWGIFFFSIRQFPQRGPTNRVGSTLAL